VKLTLHLERDRFDVASGRIATKLRREKDPRDGNRESARASEPHRNRKRGLEPHEDGREPRRLRRRGKCPFEDRGLIVRKPFGYLKPGGFSRLRPRANTESNRSRQRGVSIHHAMFAEHDHLARAKGADRLVFTLEGDLRWFSRTFRTTLA
jgi:hypothetical protein